MLGFRDWGLGLVHVWVRRNLGVQYAVPRRAIVSAANKGMESPRITCTLVPEASYARRRMSLVAARRAFMLGVHGEAPGVQVAASASPLG
jgi:hypothetical protein